MSAASPATTTQNICRCRRCSRGFAHASSGAHRAGTIYSWRNARPMKTSMTPMKIGRYGSSAVNWLIQAPLIPRVSNTNGATQHSEPMIAATALAHNCLVAVCMRCSLHALSPLVECSAHAACGRGVFGRFVAVARLKQTQASSPPSAPEEFKEMDAWCRTAMSRAMASPRPLPPSVLSTRR